MKTNEKPERSLRIRKIAKIWAMARQLSMDSDMLHAVVLNCTGSESIRALTMPQLNQVINVLERELRSRRRSSRLTSAQRAKIFKFMYLLNWQKHQVDGFARRVTGKPKIEWLSHREAWQVIEGLKAMVQRHGPHQDVHR